MGESEPCSFIHFLSVSQPHTQIVLVEQLPFIRMLLRIDQCILPLVHIHTHIHIPTSTSHPEVTGDELLSRRRHETHGTFVKCSASGLHTVGLA